jgi:beta-lactam-binding protein with PASTA domain
MIERSGEASVDGGRMPDLRGRALRQALAALAPLGARVELAGHGRVVQQSPAPGDALADDAVVRLTLTAGERALVAAGGAR